MLLLDSENNLFTQLNSKVSIFRYLGIEENKILIKKNKLRRFKAKIEVNIISTGFNEGLKKMSQILISFGDKGLKLY